MTNPEPNSPIIPTKPIKRKTREPGDAPKMKLLGTKKQTETERERERERERTLEGGFGRGQPLKMQKREKKKRAIEKTAERYLKPVSFQTVVVWFIGTKPALFPTTSAVLPRVFCFLSFSNIFINIILKIT